MNLDQFPIICPVRPNGSMLDYFVLGYWMPWDKIQLFIREVKLSRSCILSTLPRARENADYRRLAFRLQGKKVNAKAHRVAYELFIGPLEGYIVMHTCDVQACVYPQHLVRGTPVENVVDRNTKGRTHGHISKEKWAEIDRRLTAGEQQSLIADTLNISRSVVCNRLKKLENR